MTEQNKPKRVTFDNMKALSEINNLQLAQMSKDAEKMQAELEMIAKLVRSRMQESVKETVVAKEEKVSVEEQSTQKVETVDSVKEPKVEKKQTENVSNSNKQTNYKQFKERDQKSEREKAERKGYQPRQNQGNFTPNNVQQGKFTNRNNSGTNGQRNQSRGQQGGAGNWNNGNRSQRPQGGQFNKGGDNKPNRPQTGARSAPKSSVVEAVIIPQTNKRVFDKKKDDHKRTTSYEDSGRNNKRTLMRKGLLEESNIEERIRSNRKIKAKKKVDVVVAAPIDHCVISTENITVKQLSEKTGKSVADILKQLMVLGMMSNVNSTIDFPTAELVASELGVVLEQKLEKSYEEKLAEEFGGADDIDEATSVVRPPIVTILGHVDHGKTSLLDFIRKTHIQSQEAGGITQNISAYQIKTNNRLVTFIDTPGHEAFSAMRARGASVTDIAILVVAGDDGVKPQTLEAIKHIKEAKIPMIVAVNKMDKPEANFDRVKQQLAEVEVLPEEWGGDTIFVPISALTGMGVDKLLEMVLLVADVTELKANPDRNALGMIIEAKLDKGKGPVATAIILNGTLHVGDTIISGIHTGKVRAIFDDKGKSVKAAPPSAPVSVLGLDGVPNAGDQLYAVDAKFSKDVLAERKRKIQQDKINAKNLFSMEEFLAKSADSEKKVFNCIVKADVQGSFEALTEILNKINNEEVRVECIHGGVGTINENDVLLAKNANALIIGFNVKPDSKASIIAEHDKVQIYQSKIIYQITEHVSKIIKAMRTPVFEEQVIGHAEVIRTFKISRIGTVAGCIVKDGKITKNAKIRLIRKGEKLVETTITTLQRDKADVKEVVAGMECGIKMEGHNDIILEDIIEAFVMVEVERD
ncbi:MAG: translation initiation factor IF-2 [Clostridia bacterium]|nr:translation initiation factor IF-2 [Clostridia bacterium]